MQVVSENRSLNRLPCTLAVSGRGRSAALGQITDISLDGVFIATASPLAEGTVMPIAFRLGDAGAEVRPQVEVVRRSAQGMGLRFLTMSQQDSRRLRRYIAEVSSVVGHRHLATERLNDAAGRMTAPVDDPERIRALLTQSAGSSLFTVIPEARTVREKAQLVAVEQAALRFATSIGDHLSRDSTGAQTEQKTT